jgi:hypothetical protein
MKKLLVASAFAALPLAAHAADLGSTEYTWIGDDAPPGRQATVTFSLAATHFDMDVTNGLAAAIFDANSGAFLRPADDGFRFDTWGVTGNIEAWMPAHGSAYLIGGLEGAWVEDDMSAVITYADTERLLALRFGDTALTIGTSPGDPIDFSASSEFYRVAGLAGWGANVATGTKIGVGAYVAYSELDLDAAYRNMNVIERFSQLDETVKTWSGGVALLVESRRELTSVIGVFFKGRAAALYANGDLDANQNIGDRYFPSADDSAEAFAGLAEGQVGFDFALGSHTTLSVFGGAAWRNDVFEIVNPSAVPGDLQDVVYGYPHLEQTDLIEYSAGGKVELTF